MHSPDRTSKGGVRREHEPYETVSVGSSQVGEPFAVFIPELATLNSHGSINHKMTVNPWTSCSTMELPVDVIELLCSFFTGFDAFNLSLTNSWWRFYLTDDTFWRKRCKSVADADFLNAKWGISWRKQYIQARSMLFKSLKVERESGELDAFSLLAYADELRGFNSRRRPTYFQLTRLDVAGFSFDMRFSLLPASKDEFYGGILLGSQSSGRDSGHWPYYHQQFVMVSSTGDLYCSVLAGKSVVASNLQPNRWYHLTLTYDGDHQRQEVYLDGDKIRSEIGSLHHEWDELS